MGAPDFIRLDLIGYGGGGKDGGESSGGTEAADSLHNRSTAKIIDLISTGPIYGPVDGFKSISVDGTPLQNADGSFNARSVQVDFSQWHADSRSYSRLSECRKMKSASVSS